MLSLPNSLDHASASRCSRSERPSATTRAPLDNRARAKARPRKPDAPVSTAVFPATENRVELLRSDDSKGNSGLRQLQGLLLSYKRMHPSKERGSLPDIRLARPFSPWESTALSYSGKSPADDLTRLL